ncbi:MAG: hypothetical protein IT429_18345 [Gemmataceae bacterium]|nr:hypothetical protein [Gemmataceae bacterium]
MCLSHTHLLNRTALGMLALIGVTWLFEASPVAAQPPGGSRRIGPDTRAFQATMARQQQRRQQAAAPQPASLPAPVPRAPTPAGLDVVVTAPAAAAPAYITLRGPDGEVRRFALQGGATAFQTRQIVVRPGQSVTVTVLTPSPAK